MCGGRIRETNMVKSPFIAVAFASACSFVFADDNHQADIEIVVDAKGNASLNQPTSLVRTVTADEIKRSGISSINDVFTDLFLLPISGDSIGNGVLGFPDLGGYGEASKSNTLILLNGRPLNNPTLEAPNLSFIPLNSIVRIDMYQGGASTLFGSGAMGGVVNIVTNQNDLLAGNELYAQTGSFGFGKTGANTSTQLNDSVTLSANADFVTKDGYRHHSDYQSSAGSIAIFSQDLDHRWSLAYSNSFQQRKDAGATTAASVSEDRKAPGTKSILDHRTESFFADLSLQNENTRYDFHFSLRDSSQNGEYVDSFSIDQSTKVTNIDVSGQNLDTDQIAGLAVQHAAYNQGYFSNPRYQDRVDLFARQKLSIYEGSHTVVGARFAYLDDRISTSNKKQQNTIAGEVLHTIETDFGSVGLGIDRAFRYASLDENASQILAPQTGNSIRTLISRGEFSAEIYYSQLQNEIIYDGSNNVNIDNTSRHGGRLSYSHGVTPRTRLTATANWIQTKIKSGTFDGKEVPGVPSLTGGLKIESKLSEHQTLNLSTLYVANSYPWSDFDNSLGKTNAHTTTTASWSYAKERLRGILKINNLFDQTYNAYEIDAYSGHLITPAEPLSFEIGVEYKF